MSAFSRIRDAMVIARARVARPFSRLIALQEGAGWIIDREAREVIRTANRLCIPGNVVNSHPWKTPQCVHVCSQFVFARADIRSMSPRMSVDFFHGYSETNPHFAESLHALAAFPGDVLRIRVSNSLTEAWVRSSGIPGNCVFRIPIGIRLEQFPLRTPESRAAVRLKLGIPDGAYLIGSFQKDGVGWGEGMEPKLIKGPDVFLRTMEVLRPRMQELTVLLSGPARGYMKSGLDRLGIPWHHILAESPQEIGSLYQGLDAYVMSSRDEGGPKSVLEALATGVPLITTRAGQAVDLIRDGENGFLADVGDAEALAHHVERVTHMDASSLRHLAASGRRTAEANSYEAQDPLWDAFFTNYVAR